MTSRIAAEKPGAARKRSPKPPVPATQAEEAGVEIGRVLKDTSLPWLVPELFETTTR